MKNVSPVNVVISRWSRNQWIGNRKRLEPLCPGAESETGTNETALPSEPKLESEPTLLHPSVETENCRQEPSPEEASELQSQNHIRKRVWTLNKKFSLGGIPRFYLKFDATFPQGPGLIGKGHGLPHQFLGFTLKSMRFSPPHIPLVSFERRICPFWGNFASYVSYAREERGCLQNPHFTRIKAPFFNPFKLDQVSFPLLTKHNNHSKPTELTNDDKASGENQKTRAKKHPQPKEVSKEI